MSDLLEFRHLKYIVAVAETANFTRAAERLFLAQPSLSKQIKDLEDAIGLRIFVRNRDGTYITPAGQMVVCYAQEALNARNEIIKAARAVHRGEVPVLRIGFRSSIPPSLRCTRICSTPDSPTFQFREDPTQPTSSRTMPQIWASA